MAVTARHHNDEDKLTMALRKVVAEDPALTVEQNDETGQTVLRGMGDAHIKVTLDRLRRRHGVEVATDGLRVPYRETLNGPIETEGRHKKQTGGRGQFGVATVRFEPLDRGAGFEFEDEIVGAAIPRGLVPAVEKGIVESMARGGRFGFPVVDIRARVTDGKHHTVDSDEMSFKMAGSLAFREAITGAGTTVLEPFSVVSVTAPDDLQGEILGDLSSRRGQVTGTEVGPGRAGDHRGGLGAVVGDRLVRDRAAVDDPRPGSLHRRVRPVRADAAPPRGRPGRAPGRGVDRLRSCGRCPPSRAPARSRLRILPVPVRGSSSTQSIDRGRL